MLLKLERTGHLRLARRRTNPSHGFHNRPVPLVTHATEPIRAKLGELQPLTVSIVETGAEALLLFNCLLQRFHCLGHRNTVGENLRYLVCDRLDRPVACMLFGATAWKCAVRDAFLGWERAVRGHPSKAGDIFPGFAGKKIRLLLARRLFPAQPGHVAQAIINLSDRQEDLIHIPARTQQVIVHEDQRGFVDRLFDVRQF